jgi:hypothetical protein
MTPFEAAEKLRPTFHLDQMPPEDRHHVKFVEDVAAELGVDPTPFNLHQVAGALDAADIHGDDLKFPLMLYSRQHHAADGVAASIYEPRHDFTTAIVENDDQLKILGDGWVENPADLPPRGEIPIAAPPPKASDLPEPDRHEFSPHTGELLDAEKFEMAHSSDLGSGSAADGTSTRSDPDSLPADSSGPTKIKPVKNDLS